MGLTGLRTTGLITLMLGGLAACTGPLGRNSGPSATPESGPPMPLKGATASAIRENLGKPTLVRQEPPAEVWQYSGNACILDVTLYPGPDGALVARWLESRDLDGSPTDASGCLTSLGARTGGS